VINMRALVVYESMYGNTHVIASNIADGLRATHDVTLVPVAQATRELLDAADLLIVGGPTHMHGLASASSRRWAAKAADKRGSGLALDPDATGPGLREWLHGIGHGQALAAAFDTRLSGAPVTTGRASRTVSRLLKRHGYRLAADPESFLVDQQNILLKGESWRARCWGDAVGSSASHLYRPARA
jgi:menaquinone-dependent protoporphyrinogen IX oxidase